MSYAVRRFVVQFAIVLCAAVGGTRHQIANAIDLPVAGVGAMGYAYFGTSLPFVDVAHMDANWRSFESGNPSTLSISLNADGYPTSLAEEQTARSLIFTHNGGIYPTGQYILKWQGKGEIQLSGSNLSVLSSTPGQITYQVPETDFNGLTLEIVRTDPTDPIRNVSVRAPFLNSPGTFNAKYLSDLARFGVIRQMGWNSVNNSDISSWNERKSQSDFHWGSMDGVPYELQIQLSNDLQRDLWLTVPHLADDDYVHNLAMLVKQQLSPELRVWVEYSNEVWNGGFEQSHYAHDVLMPRYGVPNGAQAYGRRSAEVFDIFSSRINDPNRLVRVIAGQTANSFVLEQSLLGATVNGELKADVAAVAPYFTVDTDSLFERYRNGTVNMDQVFQELRANIDQVTGWVSSNKAVASAQGIPLVAYEGGQHLVAKPGDQHNDQGFVDLLIQINRDERMGEMYEYLLDSWYAAGGKTFAFSAETAWPNKWGAWGLKENYLDDNAVKFKAVQEYLKSYQRRTGDFDGNGIVELHDYIVFIDGVTTEGYDFDDYQALVDHLGQIGGFDSFKLALARATIPEPAVIADGGMGRSLRPIQCAAAERAGLTQLLR